MEPWQTGWIGSLKVFFHFSYDYNIFKEIMFCSLKFKSSMYKYNSKLMTSVYSNINWQHISLMCTLNCVNNQTINYNKYLHKTNFDFSDKMESGKISKHSCALEALTRSVSLTSVALFRNVQKDSHRCHGNKTQKHLIMESISELSGAAGKLLFCSAYWQHVWFEGIK